MHRTEGHTLIWRTRQSSKTLIINVPHFFRKYRHFHICIVQTNVYSLTQCSHLLTALSVIWQLTSCPKRNIAMWLLSCLQDDGGLWNWRRSPGSPLSSQGHGGISVIHLFPKVHIQIHLFVKHVEDFFECSQLAFVSHLSYAVLSQSLTPLFHVFDSGCWFVCIASLICVWVLQCNN